MQYKNENTDLALGGGWTEYDGSHYGDVTWSSAGGVPPDYKYYNVTAKKTDFNSYLKWQQQFGTWFTGFADLQWRQINYWINGFDSNPTLLVFNRYNFINPKAGVSFNKGPWQAYLSFARATHEPNRNDFETGVTQQPVPETVNDIETGLSKKTPVYNWSLTGYYMLYKDQLVLTGKINDVGEYTRTNTPRSWRVGLELQAGIKPVKWLQLSGNLTISQNKISDYTSYTDDGSGSQLSTQYKETSIALSPNVIAAASISFYPSSVLEISLPAKFVGNSYLDNTGSSDKQIANYYVQQVRIIYSPKIKSAAGINFVLYLNNIFDKQYEATGYTYGYYSGATLVNENFLFPQAGRNMVFSVNIKI